MSDDSRTTVTVTIGGEEYTIRSEATPGYTRECAAYLNERLEGVIEQGSLVEVRKAAILAALSITDELFRARADADALREAFARRSDELAAEVESALRSGELASRP